MIEIPYMILYIFLFLSLNFEVFLLITYFESRLDIKKEEENSKLGVTKYPSVTIIVPCWNEETTVSKTIHSILNLDYPKDKLKIMIVDDGSKDRTWEVVQKFKTNPQIELHTKENGGKYTALNYGLSKLTTDLVGCLDADSYVHKDALKTIVTYFQDKEIMSVTPSIKIWEPKGILQNFQKAEYSLPIFTRKMFNYMHAIYITPGPFSIFRKEVFEKLGGYKRAHNTEDIEIALRMQKNGYKITHAHNAFVYTVAPKTLPKLLKQRVRWSYGLIKNTTDYRDMIFNKKYGNLGLFVLPMAVLSIVSILFVSSMYVISMIKVIAGVYTKIQTVGFNFNWSWINFDWFYINTGVIPLIGIVVTIATVGMVLVSRKMSDGKMHIGMDLIYYFALYMFIAPLWIAKATYNALFGIRANWR